MRIARRAMHDPTRLRWLRWIVIVALLCLGLGFAIGGPRILISTGAFAIYGHIPGGLYTHGVVMTTLGVMLAGGSALPLFGRPEPWRYINVVLKIVSMYLGWSWGLFLLAPAVEGGAFSYVATILWAVLTSLPVILAITPPPLVMPKNETDLIRAAVGVGIGPEQATALARAFVHGGARDTH